MSTIATIESKVADRLEQLATDPLKFWDAQLEIRPAIVEALNEAALITGEPEVRSPSLFTLGTTDNLQNMPTGAVALVRMEGTGGMPVRKVSSWDLDRENLNWRGETGDTVKNWFPFGLTKFGIYPRLTAPMTVVLTYIALPVTAARPYVGTETIPFQDEYLDGFAEAAAHFLRLKEGGPDFQQSMQEYDRFLQTMGTLSKFAIKKGSLRFTKGFGPEARLHPVEQR